MSALQTFRDTILLISPPWLRRFWGSRLLYAFGIQVDALVDAAAMAVETRFPSLTPSGGLAYIGQERSIPRGFDEPDDSYVSRLRYWIQDRLIKGSPYAVMWQLRGYCTGHPMTFRTVNVNGAWHSITAAGDMEYYRSCPPNWAWDGLGPELCRWWLLLYPPDTLWTDEGNWGDPGNYGDGGVWGLTMTPAQVESFRALVRQWKAAGTRCVSIIVVLNAYSLQPTIPTDDPEMPDTHWGNWGKNDGGTWVPSRIDAARYIDPEGPTS